MPSDATWSRIGADEARSFAADTLLSGSRTLPVVALTTPLGNDRATVEFANVAVHDEVGFRGEGGSTARCAVSDACARRRAWQSRERAVGSVTNRAGVRSP